MNTRKALNHLRKADPVLASLIKRIGPCRMEVNETHDLFLALARAIVYQQLHGKAAATILQRVCDLFPRSGAGFTAKDIMRCADDKLRAAGLSRNKLLALRDLSAKTLDGTLPMLDDLHALDDETIIEKLTTVRGIGRWTVEMLLMFRLGRPDVLPVDDFGVRKGFMLAFNKRKMPTPKQLAAYGKRWAPYRSVASWYLWRAADQGKTTK
jgi:3-methyladenine DNA glycosylase/8-oxoguanine DNA glycosylase